MDGKKTRMAAGALGIGAALLVAIATHEGYRGEAYRDAAGIPTIGYGETSGVKMGDKTTPERALVQLLESTEKHADAIRACIDTYNEVTGENATPFTMGGGTYARHFPYAVSFGPEHEDVKLPEFGGPMHGANEAAPIDKLLEAVKIYILALLRLEEIDF